MGLSLRDGVPTFVDNFLNLERTVLRAPVALPEDEHEIVLRFDHSGGAQGSQPI